MDANKVKDALEGLTQRNEGDALLDDWTIRLLNAVYERALDGLTNAEIVGYVAYRKRIAKGPDKDKAQRVIKAIKTDRWGVASDVAALQNVAAERRRARRENRQIRETWYMQQREVNAMIPDNRRGGGGKSGRSRKRDHVRSMPDWMLN